MGGTKHQYQCGSNEECTVLLLSSLKNLTIGLIWLVTRGGWGGGVGAGGPGRRARGGDGGGSLGLIWLLTRGGWGRRGGVKSVIPASAVTCPTPRQCMMSICSRF